MMGEKLDQYKQKHDPNGVTPSIRNGVLTSYTKRIDDCLKDNMNDRVKEIPEQTKCDSDTVVKNEVIDSDEDGQKLEPSKPIDTSGSGKRENDNQSPIRNPTTSFSVADILDPRKFTGATTGSKSMDPGSGRIHPWLVRKHGDNPEDSEDERMMDDSGIKK